MAAPVEVIFTSPEVDVALMPPPKSAPDAPMESLILTSILPEVVWA